MPRRLRLPFCAHTRSMFSFFKKKPSPPAATDTPVVPTPSPAESRTEPAAASPAPSEPPAGAGGWLGKLRRSFGAEAQTPEPPSPALPDDLPLAQQALANALQAAPLSSAGPAVGSLDRCPPGRARHAPARSAPRCSGWSASWR